MIGLVPKKTSKFDDLESYNLSLAQGYQLLPFRFIRLDKDRYVLTNDVGEYLVLQEDDLPALVGKTIEPASRLYNDLKSKHFLLDTDSSVALELLAMKYRTKMQQVSNFTGLHMFVVTLRCDHACPYCQVSRQSEDRLAFDMTTETAAKSLDVTFRSPSPTIKIEFQGGEPLLNFELIKWIVIEAKRRNQEHKKDLEFVIATNLALLTDEILSFCQEHGVFLSTSLDGPEDLHVANRPRPGSDSYQRVIQGIKRARSLLGPDKVSALMTTTKASLSRAREIIDEYLRQDFNSIFLRPLSPYGFAVKTKWYQSYDIQGWLQFYFEGLDYIIELNKQGCFMVEQYAAIVLGKMFSPQGTGYVDLQSPAGIGISAIVFNYDADVYASDESRMLAEMGDKTFRLGNIHENSYEEIMLSNALLDPIEQSIAESVPSCNDCGFQPYCGSDPVYHHATQKDVVGHKALSGFCKKNMAIMRRLISLMEDDAVARQVLLSWVKL
jgi:uncharacterized protein